MIGSVLRIVVLAGSGALPALADVPASRDRPNMAAIERDAPDRMALFRDYSQCSAQAETHVLSRSEISHCSRLYLALKLTFVENMTIERYDRLDAAQRAEVNRVGYAGYRDWAQKRFVASR